MSDLEAFWVLLILAGVAYFARASGLLIMAWVPLSFRVKRFLEALSGSVLVALVIPPLLSSSLELQLAALLSLVWMIWRRQMLVALLLGVGFAAGFRALNGIAL